MFSPSMSKVPSANRRGYRSLSEAFDDVAKFTPDRVYAKVPRSDDLRDGFDEVSMGQMEHAVDSCAHWLLKQSQGIRDDFETIGYVGLYDLRYPMMFWASLKCGKKVGTDCAASRRCMNLIVLASTHLPCERLITECIIAAIGFLPKVLLLQRERRARPESETVHARPPNFHS